MGPINQACVSWGAQSYLLDGVISEIDRHLIGANGVLLHTNYFSKAVQTKIPILNLHAPTMLRAILAWCSKVHQSLMGKFGWFMHIIVIE